MEPIKKNTGKKLTSKECSNFVKDFRHNFTEYSRESTIHSVNYIGRQDAHWIERIFWLFCLLFSLSISIHLGCQTYIRWKSNPVITAFNQGQTHVSEIPFPAVTLCALNESKYESKIDALYDDFDTYVPKYNLTSKDYIDNLKNITTEFVTHLRYERIKKNGSEVFRRTILEEHICFTYNMIEDDDMFTENIAKTLIDHGEYDSNYVRNSGEDYPHRAKSAELFESIRIKLDNTDDIASMTNIIMIIHSPYDYPKRSVDFIPIKLGVTNKVLISPQIIETDDELIKYKPEVRECIFGAETKLEFFKYYTQSNCELECKTHYLLKKCSCVKFHMLHNESTRICQTIDEIDCSAYATDHLYYSEKSLNKCKCLPQCNEITYSMSATHFSRSFKRYDSFIVLAYKTDRFVAMKRQEVFGLVEFLSSIGGFLGLSTGASLLSLIQIFYHFFIKKCCKEKGEDQEQTRLNNVENGTADKGPGLDKVCVSCWSETSQTNQERTKNLVGTKFRTYKRLQTLSDPGPTQTKD